MHKISMIILGSLLCLFGCSDKHTVPPYQEHLPPRYLAEPKPAQQQSTKRLLNQAYDEWYGVPHKDGGLSKKGIDCSGFVHLVFRDNLNHSLPRTTTSLARTGIAISQQQLKPGDLVLFKIRRNVNHVGIYTGNDQFIHASKSKGVWRSQLSLPYWQEHYWQSRRVYR